MTGNTDRACYSGYILKALADVEVNLTNIIHWNSLCSVLDEKTNAQIEHIRYGIDVLRKKTNENVMNEYGVIVFPDSPIDWEQKQWFIERMGKN